MSIVIAAALIGFSIGAAGTMAGGTVILAWKRPSPKAQALLLGFSGGIMLAVVCFDLWPGAWHNGGPLYTAFGTATGVMLIGACDRILPALPGLGGRLTRLAMTGLLVGLGIGTHNFPEGVALGTAYAAAANPSGWVGLALLMGLHNIPEGTIMAATLRLGGVGANRILLALALVEIPMAAGAAVGGIFGRLSAPAISSALAFAGGAMCFVVLQELLPTAERIGGRTAAWRGTALGLALGVLLTRLV